MEEDDTEWGWSMSRYGLISTGTLGQPFPIFLLKSMSSKKVGTAPCTCRKAGECSVLCSICFGNTCQNVTRIILNEDGGDTEEPDLEKQPEPVLVSLVTEYQPGSYLKK